MRRFPLALALTACQPEPAPSSTGWAQGPGARFDLHDEDFFGTPFPGSHHLDDQGTVDLTRYPNPEGLALVENVLALLDGQATGFSTTSAVFFPFSEELAALPPQTLDQSVDSGAQVVLIDVDPDSPEQGRRFPVDLGWSGEGQPLGAAHTLSLLPLQGIPLRPQTIYSAAVLGPLEAATGEPLVPPVALQQLQAGLTPDGFSDTEATRWQDAIRALEHTGVDTDALLALTVFETWDPTAGMVALDAAVSALPPPEVVDVAQTEVFDEFCVYEGTVDMPVYQEGEPPFTSSGGGIVFEAGEPVLQSWETARVVLTLPRGSAPEAGWPTALMIRTGGGGDRPLVDRGPRDADGNALVEGTGPALHFARAGFAGISVDGPHGGIRNVTGADEQFLVFNIANPAALRDNLRQTAVEAAWVPELLDTLSLDVSDCDGATDADGGSVAAFATDTLALMGHSMGGTVAPLTLAVESRFGAVILSGAGGSWTENIMHKQKPLEVRPLAEALLGYESGQLTEHDPFLNLLQWGGEVADPPVYAETIMSPEDGSVRHVLMLQGIVDRYILPPIANATSLSLGLDLGGTPLDEDHAELAELRPLSEVMGLVGSEVIALPAAGNHGSGATALVIQHPEDGIEDGHEVVFQTEAPQHQLRCFLEGFSAGETPTIPEGGSALDPCD